MSNATYVNEDLNVLNFERIKWGGVRLNWLIYCLLDLECLVKEQEALNVSEDDVAILQQMVAAIESCNDTDAARQLEKRWKMFSSPINMNEMWSWKSGVMRDYSYQRMIIARSVDVELILCQWRLGETGWLFTGKDEVLLCLLPIKLRIIDIAKEF